MAYRLISDKTGECAGTYPWIFYSEAEANEMLAKIKPSVPTAYVAGPFNF